MESSSEPPPFQLSLPLPHTLQVSVPSILDSSLAPEGHHVIHAYTAGGEPPKPPDAAHLGRTSAAPWLQAGNEPYHIW